MSVTVANTAANISGDTLLTAENAETLTGQKTFSNTVLFSPDNTYDIGASGATRPRDVFIGDDLVVGDGATIGGTLGVTGATTLSSTLAVTSAISGRHTYISNTETGSQNNWAPTGLSGDTVMEWSGASDAAITGIAGGASGQRLTIFNRSGTKVMTFAHNSGSSSSGNKFSLMATSAVTPIANGGYATFFYDGTFWCLTSHDQGTWITPTFDAGDFTAFAAGTWTVASGDVQTMCYKLAGRELHLIVSLLTTTVARSGADPTILIVSNDQWGTFTSARAFATPCYLADNGTPSIGYVTAAAAGANLQHILVNGAQFANSTDATQVRHMISFEVT